ncbi:MAG: murein DD-endopeptidase MepM/ murein hydrolase activator NlpD [Oleiphilaceae bacterium]|jgi:murein DD-endopeptidase MepM/ murein hydrolase activator NlpD
MNIIFVGKKHGKSKTVQFANQQFVWLFFVAVLLLFGLIFAGYQLRVMFEGGAKLTIENTIVEKWDQQLEDQRKELQKLKRLSQEKVDALTLRMGDMQARLMRLDALGHRLTEVAKLQNGEFDFSLSPALGGPTPALQTDESYVMPGLLESMEEIESRIVNSEQQLEVIDALFVSRNTQDELFIAGRPIKWGWMSSAYGFRTDPFSGKRAWHAGVDFAGKEDSDIVAVASGVVTWSGTRYGYGNLVEVNHGNGYTTRYAHCKTLLASVGDIIEKGQVLATMGSTGRSTGPHVHYEVRRQGKTVNPKKYIYRAN